MKKVIIVLICLISLAGCQTFKVMNCKPHELSVTEGHKTHVFFIFTKSDDKDEDAWFKEYDRLSDLANWETIYAKHQKLKGIFDEIMLGLGQYLLDKKRPPTRPGEKAAFAALPILAGASQLLSGFIIDYASSRAQDIIDSSKYPYNDTTFMTAEKFNRCKAIIIIRESKLKKPDDRGAFDGEIRQGKESDKEQNNKKTIGLIAIIKIEKEGDSACYLTPAYVIAYNSAAQTLASNPLININFAVAIKGVISKRYRYRELRLLGQAALTVKNINLANVKNNTGSYADMASLKDNKSDLIPLPYNDKSMQLSVSVSVVENGIVGFGLEPANAEIKAIKEAIGGGISGMITERFD